MGGSSKGENWEYAFTLISHNFPISLGGRGWEEQFEEFFKMLPERERGERSWRVSIEEIKVKNFDIKAVNPNRKESEDNRTPEELLSIIEFQGEEIKKAIDRFRAVE